MRVTTLVMVLGLGGVALVYAVRFLVLATKGHPLHALKRLWRCLRPWPTLVGGPLAVLASLIWLGKRSESRVDEARDGLGHVARTLRVIPSTATAPEPRTLYVALGAALLVAALRAHQVARRNDVGPIRIGEIDMSATGDNGNASEMIALVRDRLGRCSIDPPSTVPSTDGDDAQIALPATIAEAPGFAVKTAHRIASRDVRRMGYLLQATARVSERTGRKGFTYSLVNQVTHRQVHVDTIWGDAWTDSARQLACSAAAVVIGFNATPSRRWAPAWKPNEMSLRCYVEAKQQIAARHFDEAIVRCRDGISADPSGLPIRGLLGSTQEQIGHFYDALDTYSDSLNLVLYGGTGYGRWKSPPPSENADLGERYHSPRMLKPDRKLPHLRIVSDDATQLLWRYITVLTFAERWVDRWTSDLLRSSDPNRKPIVGDELVADYPEPALSELMQKRREEQTNCDDTARRLRGFLHNRYDALLRDEFPLLDALLLEEDRDDVLLIGKCDANHRPQGAGPLPVFTASTINYKGHVDPDVVSGLERWIPWLLNAFDGDAIAVALAERHVGAWPRDMGLKAPPDCWRAISNAIRSEGASEWRQLGLDRQRLAFFLLDLVRDRARQAERDETVADRQRRRVCALFAMQLDMRTFALRASIEEKEKLRKRGLVGKKEMWTRPFLSPRLVRISLLGARQKLIDRVDYLQGGGLDPNRHGKPVIENLRRSIAGLDPCPGTFSIRLESRNLYTNGTRRWTPWNELARGWTTREGTWTYWYYLACIEATSMIPDPRTLSGANYKAFNGLDLAEKHLRRRALWVSNDATAARAVEALHWAVVNRPLRSINGIEAGVADWLLYEDPDLDRLRSHPRFVRWASALWDLDYPDDAVDRYQSIVDRETRHIDDARRGAGGTADPNTSRSEALTRRANSWLTAQCIATASGAAADAWRRLALEWPERPEDDLTMRFAKEVEALRALARIQRFSSRPAERLAGWRSVAALADRTFEQERFPTGLEVIRDRYGRMPKGDELDQIVLGGFKDSESTLSALRARRFRHFEITAAVERAAQRWMKIADVLGDAARCRDDDESQEPDQAPPTSAVDVE